MDDYRIEVLENLTDDLHAALLRCDRRTAVQRLDDIRRVAQAMRYDFAPAQPMPRRGRLVEIIDPRD